MCIYIYMSEVLYCILMKIVCDLYNIVDLKLIRAFGLSLCFYICYINYLIGLIKKNKKKKKKNYSIGVFPM